jgi:hypothetical protein
MICLCGGRVQSTTRTLKTRAAQLDWHQTPTACWTHSASLLSLRGIGYTPQLTKGDNDMVNVIDNNLKISAKNEEAFKQAMLVIQSQLLGPLSQYGLTTKGDTK